MTVCVVHQDHEAEEGWLVCRRAWGRLAGSLRQIPTLVEELHGLGYVQRDTRPLVRRPVAVAYEIATRTRHLVYEDVPPDPVASALPAGPLNGSRTGARVSGSPGRSAPIRIDSTDLLAAPRRASWHVAQRSPWPDDQVGYLSVATELEFWATDWAHLRGEGRPFPSVPDLCSWLLDRLEWACQNHYAIDEFAGAVQRLSSTLYGLNGYPPARPKLMEAPCRRCKLLTLVQAFPDANIECANVECLQIVTPDEYAEHVQQLIEENTP